MQKQMLSAKVQSVNKALDLLRSRQESQAAKKHRKILNSIDDRTKFHCCSSKMHNRRNRKTKKVASSGFSHALIATEMRKCLMRHDWAHITELLPLLLRGHSETEPLMWRYLIIQILYGTKGNLAMLNHFLEMSVRTQSSDFLNVVLALPAQIKETDSMSIEFDS
ncbi:uncharacterized protein LOC124299481 isoform X1 [Neodiprion virginianus]|uniref:Uncharacterized protein LOC107224729 isoform X1 n=1 Tax=Neodiprion lecontei TaxID=441921 RepID=A0A6J0C1F8_NEOLC|nr:uncharacterized protein LOC124177243 isoform X1 [Neodiprion fabricii]XP_046474144.1 uncharacterized protein LOC124215149 isoform X1 [Neodiprion pinetum]XP_046591657.1 uncharacterized protein LOC107224729 isoform X1 [Neodiprion lecontei]XP_046608644.1 uncharacterized protein LOC124299481 isoform X1 [Neodiprion virginianus]